MCVNVGKVIIIMGIVRNITDAILNSKLRLPSEQLKFSHRMLLDYDLDHNNSSSVIGINLRDDFMHAFEEKGTQLTRLEILQSRMKVQNSFEPIFIKISDDLSKFVGSNCSIIVFDNCLQYMMKPVDAIRNALDIAQDVFCVITNYSSFKRRLHFALNGSFDFISQKPDWYSRNIIRPFGVSDFIHLCESEHFLIKHALYIAKDGYVKDAISASVMSNLYLDEATFIITKLDV